MWRDCIDYIINVNWTITSRFYKLRIIMQSADLIKYDNSYLRSLAFYQHLTTKPIRLFLQLDYIILWIHSSEYRWEY